MKNGRSNTNNSRSSRCLRNALLGATAALPFALAASAFADPVADSSHKDQLRVGRLIQVTRGDPFANCTQDDVAGQEAAFGSVLYPNTSIEPMVTVDPTDSEKVLVVHQQDRWNDGGSRGQVGVLSREDDIDDWNNTIPQGVTKCAGGSFVRASDPWADYANDGTAFFMQLTSDPADPNATPFGTQRTGMLISRSTDHGHTWHPPTTLIDETTTQALNDKNSVTADWTLNGNAYAVWDRLSLVTGPDVAAAAAQMPRLGSEGVMIAREALKRRQLKTAAAPTPAATITSFGPTLLSRTTNNGATWSKPVIIFDPGPNNQTINNIVQVAPSGTVYDFFTAIIGNTASIAFVKSTDKGVTWSGPTTAQVITPNGVVTPDAGEPVRDAAILYSVAVNKRNGAFYLVWQDARFTTTPCVTPGAGTQPVDMVAFSQSLDGGVTWSAPIRINQTPANANGCREQAFIPTIAVAKDGRHLVVTYYDFRNDKNTPPGNEATDYFAVGCDIFNDCSLPASWRGEVRLTNASFNILDAPVARGHFLGDYMGLAALDWDEFVPIFGIATGKNLTADFTRVIHAGQREDTSSSQ
jgi:hypothetical protein